MFFLHLVISLFASLVSSKEILFNAMHASDSHILAMLPVASRLSTEGHSVHFLESQCRSTGFQFPQNITNTFISIPRDEVYHKKVIPALWTELYGPSNFASVWVTGDVAFQRMIEDHQEKISELIDRKWDLVVADELFAVSSYALSLLAKRGNDSHFIVLATCCATHLMRYNYALGGNFLHRPSLHARAPYDPERFFDRLVTIWHALKIMLRMEYTISYDAVKSLKMVGIENFHFSQLAKESAYYYLGDINPLIYPAPTSNEVVYVGRSCPSTKNLSSEYLSFLEDPSSKGTILIAFGSNAEWEFAPKSLIRAFVEGINALKEYRIVFTFNGNQTNVVDIGSHCLVTKWAPQKEILAHHRTKAFLSHGGLKSVKDAICATVPLVIMPLFAEQPHNAELGRKAGISEILLKTEVTAEKMSQVIRKVAGDIEYKKKIIRMREFMLDQPISSLEMAAFTARRAMDSTGTGRFPTFKRKGIFLSLREHLHLDILAVILCLLFILTQ